MLLSARPIKVINSKITSEVLLDETLRLMKQTEVGLGTGVSSLSSEGKLDPFQKKNGSSSQYWSVHTWMDVLSGETWNLLRASYQLRQVRERIAKGLVDKGVLRNEKKSFFMFDVAIHPLVNTQVKTDLIQRLLHVLHLPWPSSGWHHVHLRTILLLLAAYAGNVLDPIFHDLSLHQKELGYQRLEALLKAFSQIEPKHKQCGGDVDGLETTQSSIHGNETRKVYSNMFGVEYPEGVAAVLSVFSKMDNLI
ncbi:hypothetical protein HMI54_011876 [Coelomomyces lativittatus]|nr:hypothetical protein HMI54_011876 [Coelomomyces lativittatus]